MERSNLRRVSRPGREAALFEGKRVIVDASFREESQRRRFLDLAAKWSVPGILLICQADAAVVKTRLENRRDDVSDADWAIYLEAAQRWEPLGTTNAPALSSDRHWSGRSAGACASTRNPRAARTLGLLSTQSVDRIQQRAGNRKKSVFGAAPSCTKRWRSTKQQSDGTRFGNRCLIQAL